MEVFGAQGQSVGLRLSHCLAPALLHQCGRGRWGARAEVLSLPFHQEELLNRGGDARLRLGKARAGFKVCGRGHSAPVSRPVKTGVYGPRYRLAPDMACQHPSACLALVPLLLFLAPPQSPGSLASSEPGQILQSCG